MAVKHYLAWTVMLAALPGAATKCNTCNVEVGIDENGVGFLEPTKCCDKIDYPFTFLAHFTADQHNITYHLHEYYLLDAQVRICQRNFYYMYDDDYYIADENAIDSSCEDDYPFRCSTETPDLNFRLWSEDGTLNITIPTKPRPVLQTHGPYADRPLFNITLERLRVGEPRPIVNGAYLTNLDKCSFNGYPVLIPDTNGTSLAFRCECVGGAYGTSCQWGGECHPHNRSRLCSRHGQCRYFRGSIKCMCDKNHFGYRCEHPIASSQSLQPSVCRAMGLKCSHMCSVERKPHCLCPPYLVLHNTTHCIPRAQLVDVTVQLLDNHHHHHPLDQAKNLLWDACITVVNTSYQNDSKEFHFTMNKYWRNCLPEKSQWEAVLESPVNLSLPNHNFLWLGPLNTSVEEGSLVLKCTVYTSLLPVNVSFFIGHHRIYTSEVDSCDGYYHDDVITVTLEEDVANTNTTDNTCSHNTICTNDAICTITFIADGYDPDLDWGQFSVEVSQGNTSTRQSVVVDANPRMLLVVKPLSAAVNKSDNITLTCTLLGDWKWNEDCEIKWVFPLDSGVFEVETPAWNVSYLYIKHLKQSITVTCEVAIWRFCDDRSNRNKSLCVGRGCKPQVVAIHCIHCLDPETLTCPAQNTSVVWHTTPVNAMSYSDCPEGFKGTSARHCKAGENDTAVWAEPDYYHCVYRPFNNFLQRPVMRYLKRGYHVTVDCNSTVMEMKQLFEARRSMLLPREYSFIQDQVKLLLRPNVTPIDQLVFLGFLQEIRKKMAVKDTWQLLPLLRTYLSLDTNQRGYRNLDDLLLWVEDVPAEWEYNRLHMKVTLPQMDMKTVRVGALVFLDPKSIPAGVMSVPKTGKEQIVGHELSGPAVELVLPTSHDLPFTSKSITFNMSYYDPDVTTDRNVCGGAEVSGALDETVEWDLTRCTVLSLEHRGRRVTRCHCQGTGLFAFIRMPEIQTDESALKRLVVAAVTCCTIILLLLILGRIYFLSAASSVPSDRQRQRNAGSRLMDQLIARMTSYVPCFSSNPDSQNHKKRPSISSVSESPHSSSGSINVRRRPKETCPADSYVDMAVNIKKLIHFHTYENVFNLSESELQLTQGSHVSDNVYEFPYTDVYIHASDPDDGQC